MIADRPEDYIHLAERQLGIMRQRNLFFSQSRLFEDTPWELLLEIFVACEERDFVTETELVNTLAAPRSILHRWLDVFEDCGYIKILRDHGSRTFTITDNAREECVSFLVTLTNQSLHLPQPQ